MEDTYPILSIDKFNIPDSWSPTWCMLLRNIFKYVIAQGYRPFDFTPELFEKLKHDDWLKFMFNLDNHIAFYCTKI